MTTLIFGIGIGLFILITIWLLAGIIFSISSKTDKKFGFIAITIATLITLILICLPKNSEHPNIKEEKLYDHYFILRISLVILLAASSIIAGIGYVNYALMETKIILSKNYKKFEITDNTEFVSKVMNSSVPVIVNFHAEWCDPCTILTPKLEELISPMNDLNLAVVNVDKNPELVHTFEVKAVPAVIAVSNGLVVDKFIGLVDANMIDNLIKKLRNQKPDVVDNKV